MPRVIHFEIHADQPERALKFYSDIFGWEFHKWESPQEYWLVNTGDPKKPGINGGMMKRHPGQKGDAVIAYVCTIDVPSVDEYIGKVQANGGTNVVPKASIPGLGWYTYCKDTEGNIFGMMEEDKNAR